VIAFFKTPFYYRGSITDFEENVVHDYSKHKRKSIYKKPAPNQTKTQSFSFMKQNPKLNSKGNHLTGSTTSSKLTSHTSFAKFTKDATFEMSETGLNNRKHKVSIARETCLKGIPHAAPLGGGIPEESEESNLSVNIRPLDDYELNEKFRASQFDVDFENLDENEDTFDASPSGALFRTIQKRDRQKQRAVKMHDKSRKKQKKVRENDFKKSGDSAKQKAEQARKDTAR